MRLGHVSHWGRKAVWLNKKNRNLYHESVREKLIKWISVVYSTANSQFRFVSSLW